MDVDGNGAIEWFPISGSLYPPFTWGRSNFYEQTFTPDTVFRNPRPSQYNYSSGEDRLGSINGSKFKSYSLCWVWEAMLGTVNWIYQAGPGWRQQAIACFGIYELEDDIIPEPYDIGDFNGDNIDDFALLPDRVAPNHVTVVRFYMGNAKFLPVEEPRGETATGKSFIGIYPNPVSSLGSTMIHVKFRLDKPSEVRITVVDTPGRTILRDARNMPTNGICQIPIDVSTLRSGQYFVMLEADGKTEIKPLTIITK